MNYIKLTQKQVAIMIDLANYGRITAISKNNCNRYQSAFTIESINNEVACTMIGLTHYDKESITNGINKSLKENKITSLEFTFLSDATAFPQSARKLIFGSITYYAPITSRKSTLHATNYFNDKLIERTSSKLIDLLSALYNFTFQSSNHSTITINKLKQRLPAIIDDSCTNAINDLLDCDEELNSLFYYDAIGFWQYVKSLCRNY